MALGNLSGHGDPAVPALLECLKDVSGGVRATAAWSLGRLGASIAPAVCSTVVSALKECLEDAVANVRKAAATLQVSSIEVQH